LVKNLPNNGCLVGIGLGALGVLSLGFLKAKPRQKKETFNQGRAQGVKKKDRGPRFNPTLKPFPTPLLKGKPNLPKGAQGPQRLGNKNAKANLWGKKEWEPSLPRKPFQLESFWNNLVKKGFSWNLIP